VGGFKFRRQHIVDGYVVDFYCPALRLVIEVDGGIHETQAEQDAARSAHLQRRGAQILRLPNERILSAPAATLTQILTLCTHLQATRPHQSATLPVATPRQPSNNASKKDPPFPRNRLSIDQICSFPLNLWGSDASRWHASGHQRGASVGVGGVR
jgi:hypothetical protein